MKKEESMTKQNPFDAAIDLLKTERQIIARALDRTDSVEGQAYRQARFDQNEAAIRLLEAGGKLNAGDMAWFDWMMETTIAEYAPRVDGMTCPGRGRKDRFRALFAALPDEVKP